jgi:hypothetical protein
MSGRRPTSSCYGAPVANLGRQERGYPPVPTGTIMYVTKVGKEANLGLYAALSS